MQGNVRRLVRSMEPGQPEHAGGGQGGGFMGNQSMQTVSPSPHISSSPPRTPPPSSAFKTVTIPSQPVIHSFLSSPQTPTASIYQPRYGTLPAHSRPEVSSSVAEMRTNSSPVVTSSSQPIVSHIDGGGDELYNSLRKSWKRSDVQEHESHRRPDLQDDEWVSMAFDVLCSLTARDASSLEGIRVVSEDDLRVGKLLSLFNVLNPYLLLMRDDGQQVRAVHCSFLSCLIPTQEVIGVKYLFHIIANKENVNIRSTAAFKPSQVTCLPVKHCCAV
eukprot:306915-Hanusia_phi.AAC.2